MNGLLYYKKIGSTIFFYTWQLYLECIHIVNVNYIFGKKMKMMPCRKKINISTYLHMYRVARDSFG